METENGGPSGGEVAEAAEVLGEAAAAGTVAAIAADVIVGAANDAQNEATAAAAAAREAEAIANAAAARTVLEFETELNECRSSVSALADALQMQNVQLGLLLPLAEMVPLILATVSQPSTPTPEPESEPEAMPEPVLEPEAEPEAPKVAEKPKRRWT